MFNKPQVCLTRNLKFQNIYTLALDGEYRDFSFNEERAPTLKGQWRELVWKADLNTPLDLEIGTGNGKHFRHRALSNPHRLYVGIEKKYKPLIQSISGIVKNGGKNAAMARYHAMNIGDLFNQEEINNIYIHFPDPWVSPRKPNNRLLQPEILKNLFEMQKSGHFLEFKTDSKEYFDWALIHIKNSSYQIDKLSFDFHRDKLVEDYFITTFEDLFIRKQIPINYILLRKP